MGERLAAPNPTPNPSPFTGRGKPKHPKVHFLAKLVFDLSANSGNGGGGSGPRQLSVLNPVRHFGFSTETCFAILFIVRIVTFEPDNFTVAFEGQHVRRNPIEKPTIVRDHDHAAGKILQSLSKARRVFTSRSFVGSSSSKTFAPSFSILARCTRFRSPPESLDTFFC